MYLTIISALVSIICLGLLLCSRRELSSIRRQLKFLRENETNKIISSRYAFPEINRLIWEINQMLEADRRELVSLRKQEKQLKSTLTDLTHDIRTPLTSLSGYFQLMQEAGDEEDLLRYQRIISERIRSLEEILEQLFLYVKLNEGNVSFELERVNLNQTLCEVLFSFYEDLKKAGIEPEVVLPEEIYYIEASPQYLRRALQNIIKNALDHGDSHIKVSMKPVGTRIAIRIQNGIRPEEEDVDVSRVFDRFYKADEARSKTSTGLGLCIAKELVERMQGKIEAGKEKEGFYICLWFLLVKSPGE